MMKIITSCMVCSTTTRLSSRRRSSSLVDFAVITVTVTLLLCYFASVCQGASQDVWTITTASELEECSGGGGSSSRPRMNQRINLATKKKETKSKMKKIKKSNKKEDKMMKSKKSKKKKKAPMLQPTPAPTAADCAGGPFEVNSLNANQIFCNQTLRSCNYVITGPIKCTGGSGPTLSNGTILDCCGNSISDLNSSGIGITVPVDVRDTRVTNCDIGFETGYFVSGSNNVIQNCVFSSPYAGVQFNPGSNNNKVLCSKFLSGFSGINDYFGIGTSITGNFIYNKQEGIVLNDGSITCSRVANSSVSGIQIVSDSSTKSVTIDRTYVDHTNSFAGLVHFGSGKVTLLNDLAFCYNSMHDVYDGQVGGSSVIEPTPSEVACDTIGAVRSDPAPRFTCGASCPAIPENFDILSLPGCADYCPFGIGTFASSTCVT